MNYPRLLIISPSAFNYLSGGGITFTNLFKGWPKDLIATAHADSTPPTTDVCENYYHLGLKEFPWKFPFSFANAFGGQEKMEKNLKLARGAPKGASIKSDAMKAIQRFAQFVIGEEIPMDSKISHELRMFIKDFQPEIIYTIIGNLPYLRLVSKIAKEFNIPYVVHMMDDWPNMLYHSGVLSQYRRLRLEVELREFFDNAAACLSICDAMGAEYEKRYGRSFQAFHNCLDIEPWLMKSRKDWNAGHPFRIVYAGALMANSQFGSVMDTAKAVSALRKSGSDIEFEIYAPWYFANRYRSELEQDGVKVFEAPESMEIESLFSNADLLLLPVNFDKASVTYIKYSMPTKVPAYMLSGTPTLAYGPDSVASIQYAKKFGWAECVTNRDQNELRAAIRNLVHDEKRRKELGLRAQELGRERHDAVKVRKSFHRVFQAACA